jgi:hypothetical protein
MRRKAEVAWVDSGATWTEHQKLSRWIQEQTGQNIRSSTGGFRSIMVRPAGVVQGEIGATWVD